MKISENPLLSTGTDLSFDAKALKTKSVTRGRVKSNRELKRELRTKTAREAIGQIYPDCSIFGITKGQFSLIELIAAILDQTGPANLFISTWTAAGADLTAAHDLLVSGKLLSCRFLVDHTFQRRKPAFASLVRELFGADSIRVTRNHAKFSLIRNEKWNIVLKTSMNLNTNPRLEDFDIQDDTQLADFLQSLMDEIFVRVKPKALFDTIMTNERWFERL